MRYFSELKNFNVFKKALSFYLVIVFSILLTISVFTIITKVIDVMKTNNPILKPNRYKPEADNEFSIEEVVNLEIKSGDTISAILNKLKVDKTESQKIIAASKKTNDLQKLYIGQEIEAKILNTFSQEAKLNFEYSPLVQSLKFKVDVDKEIEIYRTKNNDFAVTEIAIPLKKSYALTKGVINSSLLATSIELGIPYESMLSVVKAYSYDVDFQRDIQVGDEFRVIYERFYKEDGQFSHDGNIIYASLATADRKLDLYYFQNARGDVDYFNPDGSNVRKALLKTPINVTKISSHFGMRRHPVLGYSKMHKGVDFSAPIGTPIFAAGSGVIEEMGRKGTYGNYVRIKHNNGYSTAYAHASSFAKGLKRNSQVKQGDVIAYVGATGRATGAHLHYEVLLNNKHVNPLKMNLNASVRLSGKELDSFYKFKKFVDSLKHNLSNL